ncbi:hypothetical protein TrRE_jg10988, partial [Triparma retinervis]
GDILDIFGPSISSSTPPPVAAVATPPATSTTLTADDILGTILASSKKTGGDKKNDLTAAAASDATVETPSPTHKPSAGEAFLDQIPDLSFMLKSTLQLPGLERAPNMKRDSISSALDGVF